MMVASLRVATDGTRSRSNARKRSSREIACAPSAVRSSVSATAEPSVSQLKRGSGVAFSNGMTSRLAPTGTTDWALALMQNRKVQMQTMHDANNARLHFAFCTLNSTIQQPSRTRTSTDMMHWPAPVARHCSVPTSTSEVEQIA